MFVEVCQRKKYLAKIFIIMGKINLQSVKIALERDEMMEIAGGSACGTVTGAMCAATIILCYTGPFACLAGATGIGCAIGIYSGCN